MLFASDEIKAVLMFQRPKAASIQCPSQYGIKDKKEKKKLNSCPNQW
jgi:hypothetical protein